MDLTKFRAFEKITATGTAVALTQSTYNPATRGNATKAMITIETVSIRWRVDGTAPTSTTGHLATTTDVIYLNTLQDIEKFRFIGISGTATLQVSYVDDTTVTAWQS